MKNENYEANQAQNQKIAEAAEAKTVMNGKVIPLKAAQAAQEQAAMQANQTGIQAHHDNSGEAVQAGQFAQNQQQVQKYQHEAAQVNIKEANVQSGQQHFEGAQQQTQEEMKRAEEKRIMEQSMNQEEAASKAKAKTTKKAD